MLLTSRGCIVRRQGWKLKSSEDLLEGLKEAERGAALMKPQRGEGTSDEFGLPRGR